MNRPVICYHYPLQRLNISPLASVSTQASGFFLDNITRQMLERCTFYDSQLWFWTCSTQFWKLKTSQTHSAVSEAQRLIFSIEWKEKRKAALYRSIPSGHQHLHSAKISSSYQFVKRSRRCLSVFLSVPMLLLGIQKDYTPRLIMSNISLWILPKYQLFWPMLISLSCESMSRVNCGISERL